MRKLIRIEGMSCDHCLKRVQNALAKLEGVSDVSINLKEGIAAFNAGDSVSDEVIRETIDDAGYDIVSIENMN